ncbi:MAG: hypothetical protein LBG19_09590 [Prevotellaceae bacterium]|nr:hypothetical protein [Prevotellaceae bacterium]
MESDDILPPSLHSGVARQAMPRNTGIEKFDLLNEQYSASTYLRVFPIRRKA